MNVFKKEIEHVVSSVQGFIQQKKFIDAENALNLALSKYENPANLLNLLGLVYHQQSKFPEALNEFRKAHTQNPAYLEALLNLCATFCDLGLYEKAQEVFTKIEEGTSTKSPEHNPVFSGKTANTHAISGDMYQKLGMHNEAIAEYTKATKLYNKIPDVHISLVKSLIALKKYSQALIELEQIANLFPHYVDVYLYQGIVYYRLNKKDLAKDTWEKACQCDPHNSSAKAYLRISQSWPSDPPV